MKKFKILQINPSKSDKHREAWRDVNCFGYFKAHDFEYEAVAFIDAENLDEVFQVGNIGPEEQIERLEPMHSISVGDLIEDDEGVIWSVDSFGFSKASEAPQTLKEAQAQEW